MTQTTLKLYGPRQSSALRCHWSFLEAGVAYEDVPVDMRAGEHKKPDFLKLNPNGQVPVLVDGDFVLTESMAINDYVAEKFKPELLGSNPQEKALVLQWSLWAGMNLQRYFGQLASHRWTGVRDEQAMEQSTKSLDRFMPVLDAALKGKKFLVGDHFTLADINVASTLTYKDFVEYDLNRFKHVVAWMNAMFERPAFVQAKNSEPKKA